MNRPLVWAAAAFTAGIWASGFHHHAIGWLAALEVLLLGAFLLARGLPYRDGIPIAMIFLLAGAALEINQRPARLGDALSAHCRKHPEFIYRLEGTVADAPIFTTGIDYMTVRMAVDRVSSAGGELPLRGRIVLRWSDPLRALHPGERIQVTGRLDPVLGEVNLGLRGAEDFYRTLGYHSVLRARGESVTWISSPRWSLRYWASRLRAWQAEIFAQAAPQDVQIFLRAVWLGDRATYDEDGYRPYLETGTAHILSVSGVHVGIVYLSLHWILRTVIRNRKHRNAVILVGVVLFALMTGARAPILRATIMIGLYLWAEFLDREPDAPTALSIAALLFLVFNPGLLWDTAFILSFGSLSSILLFSEALSQHLTAIPLALRQNVATTLGVSILPLPLTAHFFHLVPLVGALANLLVIPLLTGVLWLCMLVVSVAPFSVKVASLFGHAAAPIIDLIEWITLHCSRLPLAFVTVTSPTATAVLCYLVAVLALAQLLLDAERVRRWAGVAAFAALLSWCLWRPIMMPATLDFLDVGHGDAAFIRTPGGTTLLVDTGDKSDYLDVGARVVAPWLLAHGVDRLDYLVVTHPDRDHIGGAVSVLERIKVGQLILWPDASTNELEVELLKASTRLEVPVRRVQRGESIDADGASINVLHPAANAPRRGVNNGSVVLHVQWPGMNALFPGDIEVESEAEILPDLTPVDILKVPHHGSHTSSSAAFLDALAPRIGVVSTRASSRREAMGRVVIPRFKERGIALYRTDYVGGIEIRLKKGALVVRSARTERGYSLDPSDN